VPVTGGARRLRLDGFITQTSTVPSVRHKFRSFAVWQPFKKAAQITHGQRRRLDTRRGNPYG
jgi:hypothetical protein